MNLRDDLRRVAESAPLQPVAMAGIRSKARAIRRRRLAGAIGGAAVGVAAIAAATVLVLPGGGDRTNPLPSTQTPTPTSTRSASAAPPVASATSSTRVTVNLADPPAQNTYGGEIAAPNWIDGTLYDAHGTALPMSTPVSRAWQGTGGDWYGMTFAQGEWTWTRWDVRGHKLGGWPAPSSRVAVTPDGKQAAVMVVIGGAPEIDVFTAGLSSPRTVGLSLPAGEPQNGAGVDAILPNGDVVFEGEPGDVEIAHTDGSVTKLPHAYLSAVGTTADGKVLAQWQQEGPNGTEWCIGPVSETGTRSGEDCGAEDNFVRPNADRSLLVRASTGAPNHGYLTISVGPDPFTGSVGGPTEFRFPAGALVDLDDGAWLGDSYVTPVWSSGTWRLVWLSQDGYKISRSLSRSGDSDTSPYLLGAGPLAAETP